MALEMAISTAGPGVKVTSSATLQKTSQFESCMRGIPFGDVGESV